MPDDSKKKRKVVERMDKTLIQFEEGKFTRMPWLHGKDKDLTITTKNYDSSGKLKKSTDQRQYFFEEGYGKTTSGKSISTSKYNKAGDVRKNVVIGYDRKSGPQGRETDIKKTVTKNGQTKERSMNFIDRRRINKMNLK